jgi:predicted transcriptional regulator
MTIAIARGRRRLAPREPRVWFPSTESFARVLSSGNRDLLRLIAEKAPGSLEELSQLSGRKKPNLSRTLKTMAGYGLVRLERGPRGRIAPKIDHHRIELELPLVRKERAA